MSPAGPHPRRCGWPWILVAAAALAAGADGWVSAASPFARLGLMGDSAATADQFAWLDILYLAARLVAFVLAPSVIAAVGARRSAAAAALALAAACAAAAASASLPWLYGARLLQGAAGGLLLTAAQSLLFEAVSPRRQALAQAIFALGAVVVPTSVAPGLDGLLVDELSWRWIFAAAVPAGLLAAAGFGLARTPKRTPARAWRRPGLAPAAALAVAAWGAAWLASQGERWDWFSAPQALLVGVAAAAALALFPLLDRRAAAPLVQPAVFRNQGFAFGVVVSLVAGFALTGSAFLVPAFALKVLGWPATQAGLLLLPSGAFCAAGLLAAGVLIGRPGFPPLRIVPVGIASFMAAMWLMAHAAQETGAADLAAPLLLRGAGLGLLFVALTMITLGSVRPARIPQAVALFNLAKQAGGLAGLAGLQTYLAHETAWNAAVLAGDLLPGSALLEGRRSLLAAALGQGGLDPASAAAAAVAVLQRSISGQAAVLAFDDAFLLLALMFLAAAPVLVAWKLVLPRLARAAAAS